MSPIISKVQHAPTPGDLIKLRDTSPRHLANKLVKPLIFLLNGQEALDNIVDDVYHHQLVAKDSYVALVPGETVMVVHFFKEPQYIKYVDPKTPRAIIKTTKKYISSSVPFFGETKELPRELKGYIAYVLHNEKIWATDVFTSMEEFFSSYEIINN